MSTADDPTRKSRVEDAGDDGLGWSLVVAHSPTRDLAGRAFVLGDSLRLGRSASARVECVLGDDEMSRHHATVRKVGDGYVVEDQGSTNGTYVDGARATSATLKRNSVIRMGETVLVFDRTSPANTDNTSALVGRSRELLAALAELDRAAATDVPILIVGETGTGKELAAERVHAASGRRGPWVAVNCAAIPKDLVESQLFGHRKGAFTGATQDSPGVFRAANEGTLFLDEIGEISPYVQPKLLRALANHEFTPVGTSQVERSTARVVGATNADLALAVDAGDFRRDLYARIAGVVVTLPPLRERRQDICLILRGFLTQTCKDGVPVLRASFVERLLLHPWPMNVRELHTVAQRVALRASTTREFGSGDARAVLNLAATGAAPEESAESSEEPTREMLEQALARFGGNVTDVANHFGKNPKQVYRWLRKHALRAESFRR